MARRFKGSTSDYLSLPTAIISTAPYTISAWCRSFDNTNAQVIFECSHTSTAFEKIRCWYRPDSGNFEYLVWSTAAGYQQLVGGTTLPGAWFHYCAVARANNDRELYINGRSVGTNGGLCSPAPNNTTIGLQFENGGSVAQPFNGDLAQYGIWRSRALTVPEIRRLARGERPNAVQPTSDLIYWPFEQSANYDAGGRNLLTLNGAITPAPDPPQFRIVRLRDYDTSAAAGGGTVTGDASAAGVGAAAGIGAATAAATASAAGSGVALGVGSYTLAPTDAVANAAGAGTAAAVGAATAAAIATAAGLGEALGVGASIGIVSAVGNAAGSSEALGYSPQLLGGGESGRPGQAWRKRRKRIEWLPPDVDIETGERLPPPAVEAPAAPIQLSKGERKVARLVAQYRGRDDDAAERAAEQLEALHRAQNSELARFIARQQALDEQRRGLAAAAAEDDEAAVAFMQWLLRQP